MNQPLKREIDTYFEKNYNRLQTTATSLILRYNRSLDASNVLSWCYVYLIDKQQEIILYAKALGKCVLATLEAFCIRYIKSSIVWNRSNVNKENDRLHSKSVPLEVFSDRECEIQDSEDGLDNTIVLAEYQQQDNIYTEEFINSFHKSLNKLDAIAFKVYYYEGIHEVKDFAAHFDISTSQAYSTIKKLKAALRQYIIRNQIY